MATMIIDIARVCHEANRAYCLSLGDTTQPAWKNAPDWQVQSAVSGVEAILDGRVKSPSDSHTNWFNQKMKDGWVYGRVKDPAKKEHPCMMPFEELSEGQQAKDKLFFAIAQALLP
jgi:hypothetical protein